MPATTSAASLVTQDGKGVLDDVLGQVQEQEAKTKTICGGPCACTAIMNNEDDSFKAAAVGNWATMTVELPDEVGAMVKTALAAKRATMP